MPPPIVTENKDRVLANYLTQLLAALCVAQGGELRIDRKALRQITEEGSRQLLCEDTNTETDELVLRFGSKHSAVYPVEPECLLQKPISPNNPTSPDTSNPSLAGVRRPLTPEQLRALELLQTYQRRKSRVKPRTAESVTAQSELSEILGSNSIS